MNERCIVRIMAPSGLWFDELPNVSKLVTDVARRAVSESGRVHSTCEVSVVLSDDRELRLLNSEHRGIDRPTNVLSFPGEPLDDEGDEGAYTVRARPLVLGDVVVAFETIAAEARQQGKKLEHHLAHLMVHGVLHLCGFDHQRSHDAERMEDLERRILKAVGIADPYEAGEDDRNHEGGLSAIAPRLPRRTKAMKRSVSGRPAKKKDVGLRRTAVRKKAGAPIRAKARRAIPRKATKGSLKKAPTKKISGAKKSKVGGRKSAAKAATKNRGPARRASKRATAKKTGAKQKRR